MAKRVPVRRSAGETPITYANAPTAVALAVGSTSPVASVTQVAVPAPGATDTHGAIVGWSDENAYNIKFTVTDASPATSTITINGIAYTSGANYRVVSTASLIIIVTTTQSGCTTAVRTFIVSVAAAAYATAPSSINLTVGAATPVGGVTNVGFPSPGATDTTGRVTGWVASTACNIKFTVVNVSPATSTITINGAAYTSGADYTITAASTLTVVVRTTQTGRTTAVRTFTIPVAAASVLSYLNVRDYGAVGNGTTADQAAFLSCMNAAVTAGKWVYVPAGTYRFTSTLTVISGAKFFGDGPTVSIIRGNEAFGYMMNITGRTGIELDNLGFYSPTNTVSVDGIYLSGCTAPKLSNLRFTNLRYSIKTGSGNQGTNYDFDDITVVNGVTGMYLSDIYGGTFDNMDINAANLGSNQYHGQYMERNLNNLTFTNCTWSGGGGYSLQMYITGDYTSSNLTFNGCTIDASSGRAPLVMTASFSDITFNDLNIIGNAAGYANFELEPGLADLTVDTFVSEGPELLVSTGTYSNVLFKDGTHEGTALGGGTGVTFDNVTLVGGGGGESYATVPSAIVLAVGSTAPVGGIVQIVIPSPGGSDSTGRATGWVATTACKIKFTVTDNGGTSTITINGAAYTSGADYTITSTATLTVIVTTTQSGRLTAVRTFNIGVSAPPSGDYLSVMDYGAVANGTTDCTSAFSNCINAAASQGKIAYIPAGNYRINGTVSVPSNVTILGAGAGAVTISKPVSNFSWIFSIETKANVSMGGIGFLGQSYDTGPYCIWCAGNTNVTLEDMYFEDVYTGIKTGTWGTVTTPRTPGTNYTISNIEAVHCFRPLHISDINNSTINDSSFDGVPYSETTSNQTHGAYIERRLSYITFNNCTFTRCSGYNLHLYKEQDGAPWDCDHITFNNCICDAREGGKRVCVIDTGYSDIVFNTFTCWQEDVTQAIFRGRGTPGLITINDIEAYGYRLIYGFYTNGNSVDGDFYGESIGADTSYWDVSGLVHHYVEY